MKRKIDTIKSLLSYRYNKNYINIKTATAFAPANIAICKYWGKRDESLNLPVNSSLSLTLGKKGTTTTVTIIKEQEDIILLNGEKVEPNAPFSTRLIDFLDLLRPTPQTRFLIDTTNNIPTGSGNASSASGFAALVLAMDKLFVWGLDKINASILARLGSGSACRSFWPGFVKWNAGQLKDGMDSYGEHLPFEWNNLRIALLTICDKPKKISSREAMKLTIKTSPRYKDWPKQAENDLQTLENAIKKRDFETFGQTAEMNAINMHAMLLEAKPSIVYSTEETIANVKKIWALREHGTQIYFTQDAGPNLQLLFLEQDTNFIQKTFPNAEIINPFEKTI